MESRLIPTIVAAGYLNIDLIAYVPALPGADERVTAVQVQRLLGGLATNVACAAASLGEPWPVNVELITFIGDDLESQWAITEVQRRGVRTDGVVCSHGGRAPFCLILVEPDGKRAIISEPIEFDDARVEQRLRQTGIDKSSRLLYVDGYRVPAILPYLQVARSLGWHTSVDLDGLPGEWRNPQGLMELSSLFDLVFMNRGLAQAIWPDLPAGAWVDEIVKALIQRIQACCSPPTNSPYTLILTLGEHGAWIISQNSPAIHIPALAVKPVDTTGAGDVFAGVMLATWLNGKSLVEAARLAAVAAGLSTTAYGAQGFLPTAQEVLQTLQRVDGLV
jgi:sugar/nucleoside kinase (ribokinase family)